MNKVRPKETFAIMDDQAWIWDLVSQAMESFRREYVRLPSTVPIRQSWNRFRSADRIIVHWESKLRSGGAIVEEIIETSPRYDIGEKIIILTTNPTREDVVYFNELGIRRIIRLRNREKEREIATKELKHHITMPCEMDKRELAWHKILYALDTLPSEPKLETVSKIEDALKKLKSEPLSAKYLDALAHITWLKGEGEKAVRVWQDSLDQNPNYFRAYNNLIRYHRSGEQNEEALALMQKLQELNKANISRLVGMGEIQLSKNDPDRAEFFFQSALNRDAHCSGALNGMAEIKFHQGDLEGSRKLLAKSHLAYKAASRLNQAGIELVKMEQYEKALEHYTKAQYVLPQQDKGPMLFYNIGLCYSRWGKADMALAFLRIALIKEPNYKKAQKLLGQVELSIGGEDRQSAA
jgi:tetratricopeptide (TPR) repeat protein